LIILPITLELKNKTLDGRCNTNRSECIVCAKERRELSLPAAAGGGLKTMWLLMVTTKELGTYQPVDILSMGDGVLGALVVTG
jgi:hypothetical protein